MRYIIFKSYNDISQRNLDKIFKTEDEAIKYILDEINNNFIQKYITQYNKLTYYYEDIKEHPAYNVIVLFYENLPK